MKLIKKNNKGFFIFIVIMILAAIAIYGFAFYFTSQNRVINAIIESDKIRARNLARAGFEKAKLIIRDELRNKNIDFSYPGFNRVSNSEFKQSFDIGSFEIKSIKILNEVETKSAKIHKTYKDIDYYVDSNQYGVYSVYKVVVEVKIKKTDVKVTLIGLIKAIRQEINYK